MKKNYFLSFLFLTSIVYSQNIASLDTNLTRNEAIQKGSYVFIETIPKELSPQKDLLDTPVEIKRGRKIKIEFEKDGLIYFSYMKFRTKKIKKQRDSTLYWKYNHPDTIDKEDIFTVFSIEKPFFDALTEPIYQRFKGFAVSGYTVPFRLRGIGADGDNFDFESSLSLQANFVLGFGTIRSQESWLDLSLGLGITGINLNDKNTINPEGVVFEDRTANAFTLSSGILFKANRFANLGIFMGWDFLGVNDNEVDWVHDGNMWLGLGINVTFTKLDTEKPASGGKNK